MSLTQNDRRAAIEAARAEGHAAGVAEGRRLEREEVVAFLREEADAEALSADLATGMAATRRRERRDALRGALWDVERGAHRVGSPESGDTDAHSVAPEAPRSAPEGEAVSSEGGSVGEPYTRRGGGG